MMSSKTPRYKATFPRGNFNNYTICEVIESGYSYFIPYCFVHLVKKQYGGSVRAFIEWLLANMRRSNSGYATSPSYLYAQSLLSPSA